MQKRRGACGYSLTPPNILGHSPPSAQIPFVLLHSTPLLLGIFLSPPVLRFWPYLICNFVQCYGVLRRRFRPRLSVIHSLFLFYNANFIVFTATGSLLGTTFTWCSFFFGLSTTLRCHYLWAILLMCPGAPHLRHRGRHPFMTAFSFLPSYNVIFSRTFSKLSVPICIFIYTLYPKCLMVFVFSYR